MDGYIWVRVGAYGCIGLGEHEKQARKDTHGPNAHDFPTTMAGKFPEMHAWARGGTEGHRRSFMVPDGFS